MQPQLMTSAKEDYETPPWLFKVLNDIFWFNLDVAASYENHLCEYWYTKEDNGSLQHWRDRFNFLYRPKAFCNPSYNKETGLYPWLKKFKEESDNGWTVVALVAARTETKWFRIIWDHAKYVIFLYGRLKFLLDGKEVGTATFPSAIPIFTDKEWDLSSMEQYGKIIKLR